MTRNIFLILINNINNLKANTLYLGSLGEYVETNWKVSFLTALSTIPPFFKAWFS